MKSQPGAADRNSDNQNFLENGRASIPEPLENLYSLLNELAEDDNEVNANLDFEESEITPPYNDGACSDRWSNTVDPQGKITAKSDLESASEEVTTQQHQTVNKSQDRSLKKPLETSHTKKDSKGDSFQKRSKQHSDLIKAKIIEQVIPNPKLQNAKKVEETEAYSNSASNEQSNSTEPVFVSKLQSVLQDSKQNQKTSQTSFIDLDSINQEDIAETDISQQWIAEKERQINELANSVNSLIPLIVEVSKAQDNSSQEYILKAIVPIIDRIIQQRSVEDNQKMAAAIANILPDAIRQEITNVPESIGKAIAPEIALSIKEQTILNEGAIAQAMGSEMGKAIKTQIEMERDAMVDALYPVIGSTIAKYMAEVVQSINEKVDAALSPEGIKRKIRAKMQGVSEAELILQESLPSSIRAIFLIHNNSGLVMRELQPNTESPLESDLLAGMLTAIRSFAHDCIASNSELDEIDYGNFKILFETAGYCYLAVVVEGEPIRQFRDRMRTIFSQIVLKYGDAIEEYQGDPATIPQSIEPLLEELVYESTKSDDRKPPKALYWLTAFLLGGVLIPWGIVTYRSAVAHRIEQSVAIELDATPELSVYRLNSEVKKGKLTLTGRVSSSYLRNLAATISSQIATEKNLELDNQIVAVNVPVDPTITAQEVTRITKALNQKSQILIDTMYQDKTVTINGLILDSKEQKILLDTFSSIPGVENAIFVIQQELPQLKTRIYFASNSSKLSLVADSAKITEIKQFLNKYPLIKLKIIGHSDRQGTKDDNVKLAQARANIVYQTLIAEGINPNRLEIVASLNSPPDLSPEQPLWLSRCVRFESFIAEK
ncbi:OmpA family protein [Hyella patelloides]|nr:OmpA family protein [Hyella patelloides]